MMTERKRRGNYGEDLVAAELKKQGLTIIERNYRKHFGEIDLIAETQDLLVFVEVKTRGAKYIDLGELVLPCQQRKIAKAAKAYLCTYDYTDKVCRFDVALVDMSEKKPCITYIPDAFQTYDY